MPKCILSILYRQIHLVLDRASLVDQMVKKKKNLPTKVTQVRSLGQEDPLEKGITPHSSVLAWRIPWTGEPGGLSQ